MDLPDQIRCCACGTTLGESCDDRDIWDCPCGTRVRHLGGGHTRKVSPEYLSLRRELAELDLRYKSEAGPLMIRVGGSKFSPGRQEAPNRANAIFQAGVFLFFLGGGGIVALFHRYYVLGAVLIIAGIALFRVLKADGLQKIERYVALKADYDSRRTALRERLEQS